MTDTLYDAVIVGGGAAGLSAAQMLGRARRRTLVIDAGAPRNRFAAHMHGVLGHDGRSPVALLETGRVEARAYGVELLDGRVLSLADDGDRITVAHEHGTEVHCALPINAGPSRLLDDEGRPLRRRRHPHPWLVAGRLERADLASNRRSGVVRGRARGARLAADGTLEADATTR